MSSECTEITEIIYFLKLVVINFMYGCNVCMYKGLILELKSNICKHFAFFGICIHNTNFLYTEQLHFFYTLALCC